MSGLLKRRSSLAFAKQFPEAGRSRVASPSSPSHSASVLRGVGLKPPPGEGVLLPHIAGQGTEGPGAPAGSRGRGHAALVPRPWFRRRRGSRRVPEF